MANNQQVRVDLQFKGDMSDVEKKLQQLQNTLSGITSGKAIKDMAFTSDINKAVRDATKLQAILKNTTMANGNLDLTKFRSELQKSGMTVKELGNSLLSLGPQGSQAFSQLTQSIMSAEVPLKRTSTLLSNFATTLKNTAKWQISSSILHGFMSSVSSAYNYAQDLNESLNNIRIVSKQNTDQMAEFAQEANKAAKELSVTTTAYTDAALIFYQQGLEGDAVTERTDVVAKMSNVTRDSVDEVSSYMTAIWNNFDDGSQSLEHYADVITGLGAATASSSAEIAAGLEKFAAVADTVGLSYDYATSALATVVAQTRQSADTVGTAFKTLFARIEGLKLGETLEDGVDLNKYSQALAKIGVSVLDANGQLRDMDSILDDMGAKWGQISKAQQVALAQTVAGTRQYNQLVALMDNWDKVQDNLQIARSSDGELQAQADIYAESWEAAQKRVRAAWESIYSSLFDDKFFIKLTNGLGSFIEGIDKVVKSLGGLKGILPLLSVGLLNLFNKDIANGINNFVYNLQIGTKKAQNELIDFKQQIQNAYENMTSDGTLTAGASIDALKSQAAVSQAILEKEKQANALGIERTETEKLIDQYEVQRIETLGKELVLKTQALELAEREAKISRNALNQTLRENLGDNYTSAEEKNNRIKNASTLAEKNQIMATVVTPEMVQQVHEYNAAFAQLDDLTERYDNIVKSSGLEAGKNWLIDQVDELNSLNLFLQGGTEGVKNYRKEFLELIEILRTSENSQEAYNEITAKFVELSTDAGNAQKNLEQAIRRGAKTDRERQTSIDKLTKSIEANNDAIVKNNQQKSANWNLNKTENNIVQRQRDEINIPKLQMPDFGKTFTDATRSITTFGTALNSLSNVFKTLSDENASFGDKLLSVLTSGGMAITMLGSSAKGLINAFNPLVKNVEILTTLNKVTTIDLQEQLGLMAQQATAKGAIVTQEQAIVLLNKIKNGEEISQTGEEAKQLSLIAIQKGLEADQIGILTALVALSKLETTEAEKQIVLEQLKAKLQGKLNFKNIFSGLKNIGSSLTSIVGTLGTAGVVLGVVVAAVAAAVIAYKAYRNHLKAVAEEATNTAKKEQEKLQTIKEETQAIDDLTTKYAELNAQLSDLGEENARAEMFKMAVQAGQTDLAIKALASSFKSFGEILDEVSQEQNEVYKQQAKTTVEASQNAVYANLRTIKEKYTDNFGETVDIGKGHWNGQNREFNKQLQTQFGLVVDDTGHIKTEDFIKVLTTDQEKFVNFINSSSSANAKNLQEIYGQIKDSAEILKEAGAAYSDSIEKTILSSKKKSIAEIKTLKQYEKIKSDLVQSAAETDLFEYKGIKSLEEQNNWARDLILKQDSLNDRLEKQLYLQDQIIEKQGVSHTEFKDVGLKDYFHEGGKLSELDANKLIGNLPIDQTGLTKGLLRNYLMAGIESVPAEAAEAVDKALELIESRRPKEAITFSIAVKTEIEMSEEDKEELQSKIDDLTDEQLNYVTINIDRFSSIEDLEKVLNGDFKERIEAFNQKEGIITLSTAVEDLDLSKKKNTGFDSEQIHGFFNYNDKINGYDEGQFAGLETSQQLYNIMQGVDEMAAKYAEHREKAREEAEKELVVLKEQQDQLKHEGADKNINTYVDKVKDSGIETDVKTFDDMVDFLDKYNEALTKEGPELDNFVTQNKELLDIINLGDKPNKKYLEHLVKQGKQFRENQIAIQHTEEEIADYNEKIDYQIDKLQAAKQMYLAVNKEMDSLQDAYKTIKGAQDEWNKEGYLTMDTVQSLISLDNAYMSTLEVTANGIKMNEEAYVGVTQAKYASLAASIALQAQELINKYVTGELTASQLMEEMQMYASADASYSAADAALAEARATLAAKAANDEYAATIGNYLDAVEKKINLLKQAGSQVNTGNVGKVLGYSPKGGGGSKKSKETKDLKEYADEFDRFYPFQKVIDDLADAISDLAKEQEHMAGGELVGSIRYQNKLLQDQKKAYQELAKEQKKYQKEMQADLAKYGMSFDTASGNIVNYAQSTQAMLDRYNVAIEKYNKSAQSDADKKTLEAVEKEYEKFKKLVSNYQGILTEIQDTENNLDDIYYEIIANNLKEFEIMLQVKLDIGEAQRMVNDFISKINKNFKTLRKSTEEWMEMFDTALKNAHTYIDGDLGTINVDLDAVNKVKDAIDSGDYGHEGAMFASESEAITKYKELVEQLKEDADELYELYKQAWEDYIDAIDESIEAWEEVISNFDDVNDTLDHYEKIIELLHNHQDTDQGYEELLALYNQQMNLQLAKQATLKKQIETMQQEYNELIAQGAKENDKDVKAIKDAINEANKELQGSIEAYLETINKAFDKQVKQATKDYLKGALGFDIDLLSEQWDKAKKASEGYYDETERIYQLDKIRRKYNEAIDNTTDVKIQKQLAKLRDDELNKLEKMNKLTEHSVEIAEKKLAVTQAEIALKEAQDNKSQMRLQRDSQGNWNYQFVANDEDIHDKEQNLADKSNDYYEATKNALAQTQEQLIQYVRDAATEIDEIWANQELSDEQKLAKIAEVTQYYQDLIGQKSAELGIYRQDIGEATATALINYDNLDHANFQNMTEEQQELVTTLKEHNINSGLEVLTASQEYYQLIQDAAVKCNETSIEWWDLLRDTVNINSEQMTSAQQEYFDTLQRLIAEYDEAIQRSEEASGIAWSNVQQAIEYTGYSIDEVSNKVDECVERSQALSNFRDRVMDIEDAWYSVKDAITSAMEGLDDYLKRLLEVREMQEEVKRNETETTGSSEIDIATGEPAGSGGGGTPYSPTYTAPKSTFSYNMYGSTGTTWTNNQTKKEVSAPNLGRNFSAEKVSGVAAGAKQLSTPTVVNNAITPNKTSSSTYNIGDNPYKEDSWAYKLREKLFGSRFASGGYTGEWGSNPKLALLDQKELVLNASDTSKILDTVKMVRDMNSSNNEFISYLVDIINQSTDALTQVMESGINILGERMAYISDRVASALFDAGARELEQNVHIDASFPNVQNSREIEDAFNNLVNIASQRINYK